MLGLAGSAVLRLAARAGRRVVLEGFPDRGYTPDGRLVPRDQPGALVERADDVAGNAVRLAANVDSVCVHGDSPGAVEVATRVRAALPEAGFEIRAFC